MRAITGKVRLAILLLALILSGCTVIDIPGVQSAKEFSPPGCDLPGCASLVVLQSGQPGLLNVTSQGIQVEAPMAASPQTLQNGRWLIDTGQPSPDGDWIAYTTIGYHTGGPVLLHNLTSGEWTNLIEALNAHLKEDQPPFELEYWWDVIGWFPESDRLMIGPSDLSMAVIIELPSFASRVITFPGGGRGGRLFTDLAQDGSRLLFVAEDPEQELMVVDLSTHQRHGLLGIPYQHGVILNPRFSPDGSQVAYVLQENSPQVGISYALHLLAVESGQSRVLVEGNLGMTMPVWSPDGSAIAFIRSDDPAPINLLPGEVPAPEKQSVWILSIDQNQPIQISFLDQSVRSLVWAADGATIAFVAADGQVLLASTLQPGLIWQAAGPSESPALSNVFFLP